MNYWANLPVWYRTFLVNLVKHDWQQFVDYVRRTSILGHLPYTVQDRQLVRKVFGLLSRLQQPKGQKASLNHIAFVLCLGFDPERNVDYLAHAIGQGLMTPEEVIELKELITLKC